MPCSDRLLQVSTEDRSAEAAQHLEKAALLSARTLQVDSSSVGPTWSKVKESKAKTPLTQVDKCSQLLENTLSHLSEAGQTAGQVDHQHGDWA